MPDAEVPALQDNKEEKNTEQRRCALEVKRSSQRIGAAQDGVGGKIIDGGEGNNEYKKFLKPGSVD